MDATKLRELGLDELQEKYRQYKEELFNLRFQNAIGQLKNTSRIKDVRKTIARVLTIAGEKEKSRALESQSSAAGR
ncbi:50S ribosomal protein L29 [Synergistales bacterium]|nr:50S ribosomal protein L29 [Synergistales bacterium]